MTGSALNGANAACELLVTTSVGSRRAGAGQHAAAGKAVDLGSRYVDRAMLKDEVLKAPCADVRSSSKT